MVSQELYIEFNNLDSKTIKKTVIFFYKKIKEIA